MSLKSKIFDIINIIRDDKDHNKKMDISERPNADWWKEAKDMANATGETHVVIQRDHEGKFLNQFEIKPEKRLRPSKYEKYGW